MREEGYVCLSWGVTDRVPSGSRAYVRVQICMCESFRCTEQDAQENQISCCLRHGWSYTVRTNLSISGTAVYVRGTGI